MQFVNHKECFALYKTVLFRYTNGVVSNKFIIQNQNVSNAKGRKGTSNCQKNFCAKSRVKNQEQKDKVREGVLLLIEKEVLRYSTLKINDFCKGKG